MILRPNVIVLQNACRIEVMYERAAIRSVVRGVEVFVNLVYLFDKGAALGPGVADGSEAIPKGDKDDLRFGPGRVNYIDKLQVRGVVLGERYVAGGVVVIGS